MRTAGSGFSHDGHPFRWYDALLFIVCVLLFPITLLVMFVVDFDVLPRSYKFLKGTTKRFLQWGSVDGLA